MPPKAGPKATPKAGGKKGPPAAMLAKLKMKMEMQKAEEERLRKEAEEEERRRREEERLAEEQRKYEEEQRLREKEKRREEERLALKAQKSQVKTDALERMRASGFIIPDVERIRAENATAAATTEAPKPRPRREHRRPNVAANAESRSDEEETDEDDESGANADLQTEPTESEEEIDEEDWEQLAERDERRAARHSRNVELRAQREARKEEKAKAKAAAKAARAAAKAAARNGANDHVLDRVSNLRSPICCVLGHVDTGKTSLLDYMRSTDVQGAEAGGITQQIGATFFPYDSLAAVTHDLNERYHYDLRVPGLLVIDTPGHESFTNLRSRGSSLCDIAILVVDITHGLQKQTLESIRLLRERKCPFIVALNKVDRLYGWVAHPKMDIESTLSKQNASVIGEFESRVAQAKLELANQGLNAELYYKNSEKRKVVSIVPTSASTGEGVCDLLLLAVQLTQQFMENKVTYKDDLQCTVLEVKPIVGYGFTIDVILINGELHEGDAICLCGQDGPIFTQIRSLVTPQPMKELRVSGEYVHHKSIKAAMGVKVVAPDLENVVPGTPLLLVRPQDNKDAVGELVMRDAASVRTQFDPDGIGVMVQSSTLGALEALISFLHQMNIPVGNAAIGTLHKRHMYHPISMKRKNPRYAVVLAFDVTISDDAREAAEKNEVTIFEAKIIYHLFDRFTQYIKDYDQREKDRLRHIAVFPVKLNVIGAAFNQKDPIIMPVRIERGQLRQGTPLCCIDKTDEPTLIGRVISMERENKPIERGLPGMELAVKVNSDASGATFGRTIRVGDTLYSLITRPSVDAVKKFKDELVPDDVNLLATLIKMFNVPK